MSAPDTVDRVPVVLVAGYLGAGKTTLVNHVLSNQEGMRAAVIVNDFGEVNIDAELLTDHEDDTISLANGCLCCSLAGGFGETLDRLRPRSTDLDCIIIEASGVAEPQRIIGQLAGPGMGPAHTVVVIDAAEIRGLTRDRYVGRTVWAQLLSADTLLLNKTDLVPPPDLVDLREWLAEVATHATVVETTRGRVALDDLVPGWRLS